MKTLNPIGASVRVCPIITPGRSLQRSKVFSSPTKAILSGFGFLLLFGFSGLANDLQAQLFNSGREAPKIINEGPKVIKAAKPAYPPIAAARRISGKVVVGVDVDVNGMVTEAHAQSGHPILLTAAQSAALRWRFNSTRQAVGIRSAKLVFDFLKLSSPNQEDGFTAPYQMVVRWEGTPVKTAEMLPTDSSSSNDQPNESPLGKRIVLLPVRLVRSVTNALLHRDVKNSSRRSLVAVGRVIAYDQLAPLPNITSAPHSQPLLIRIQNRIRGRETSQYIKVVYSYGINEMSLPEVLFDGKSLWRFTLTRDQGCDSSLRQMNSTEREAGDTALPRLNFVNGTESPANDVTLPCYELRPANFIPISGGASQVFELNNDYVLKVAFDSLGQISGGIVVPKYYGEECEPSWTEPDYPVGLTKDESRRILAKVSELRNLGSLVSKGKLGVVTNSKLWLLDQYQSAFVRRLVNRTAENSDASASLTHSLSVYFIRPVEGVVKDKQVVDQFGLDKEFKVNVDGLWYLATKTEFERATLDSYVVIQAAGPIDAIKLCPK